MRIVCLDKMNQTVRLNPTSHDFSKEFDALKINYIKKAIAAQYEEFNHSSISVEFKRRSDRNIRLALKQIEGLKNN